MVRFKRHFSSFDTIIPTRLGSDGEPRRLQLRFVVEDISYRVDGDDEPTAACTAQMTVRTSTHYSLLAADAGADEPGALEDRPNGATADPRETQRRHEPRDRDPPAGPGRLGPAAAEALLQLKTEQVTKTYDFVYTGGRWILKTENVDPSVLDALNYAIRNQ